MWILIQLNHFTTLRHYLRSVMSIFLLVKFPSSKICNCSKSDTTAFSDFLTCQNATLIHSKLLQNVKKHAKAPALKSLGQMA